MFGDGGTLKRVDTGTLTPYPLSDLTGDKKTHIKVHSAQKKIWFNNIGLLKVPENDQKCPKMAKSAI